MTIFQKIIDRQVPADIVFEDADFLAFRDIAPQAPVHVVVIPKRRIVSMATARSADAPLLGRLLMVAAGIAADLGVAETGYRLVTNINQHGGQSVAHLHVHILGGRQLGWPPG